MIDRLELYVLWRFNLCCRRIGRWAENRAWNLQRGIKHCLSNPVQKQEMASNVLSKN